MPDPILSTVNTVAAKKTSQTQVIRKVILWTAATVGVTLMVGVALLLHKTLAPVIRTDPALAAQLETKVKQAVAAAAAGRPQVLRVDESELNSIIESRLALSRSSARNVQVAVRQIRVRLISDRIGVHAVFNVHGQDMTIDIVGRLYSRNGYAQFDPISGKIGELPIPESALKGAVQQALNSQESHRDLHLPANLGDLKVEASMLVVTYK